MPALKPPEVLSLLVAYAAEISFGIAVVASFQTRTGSIDASSETQSRKSN